VRPNDHNPPRRAIRVSTRPPGDEPEAADSPYAVERLTALSHDLGNLLDGSLRWVVIARRSLETAKSDTEQLGTVSKQLETVQGALERMADLITAAMKASASVVGSPTLSHGITLREAIEHAAQVILPQADERSIGVRVSIDDALNDMPAGPMYSVILNGLRNAIESVMEAQDVQHIRTGGEIELCASLTHPMDTRGRRHTLVAIEIKDDGRGLTNGEAAGKAFELGYSSKPGGFGLGLALCREVMREMGGVIELSRRSDKPASGRAGAVLRISFPPLSSKGRGGST
jgi:signal transduction histidine kinase